MAHQRRPRYVCADQPPMPDSTENATPPKSTRSKNSNSSVQIQIVHFSQFEFVLRDTEKSEFLDLVDAGGLVMSVETVIGQR